MEVAQLEPTADRSVHFIGTAQSLAFTLELFTIEGVAVPSYDLVRRRGMPLYQLFWGMAYGTSASSISAHRTVCGSSSCPFGMARGQTDLRPVRLIVGFAAGSSLDIIARLMAEQMTKRQG